MTDSGADNASASTGTRRSGPVGGQIGAFDSEVERPRSLTCLNSQEQIGPAGQIPAGRVRALAMRHIRCIPTSWSCATFAAT